MICLAARFGSYVGCMPEARTGVPPGHSCLVLWNPLTTHTDEEHPVPPNLLTRMNIQSRLFLLCFAVAFPLLIISLFSIWKQYQTLKFEAARATSLQAAIASRALAQWIGSQEDDLESLASLPAVRSLSPLPAQRILTAAAQTQANWHSVALVDRFGRSIATNSDATPIAADQLAAHSFFRRIIETGKPAISGYVECPYTKRGALYAGAPVLEEGRVAGVIVACIQPQAVLRLFRGLDESRGSVIVVVDDHDRVVARTIDNEKWMGKDYSQAKTVAAARTSWRGTLEAVGIADATPRTYAFERIPNQRWLLIVGVPSATIYGTAHDWLITMVLLVGCTVGLSAVLAFAASGHFTRPISKLVREAVAIGRGDLSKRVAVPSGDEIGLLARAFNQMAECLEFDQEHKLMVEHISEAIRQSLDLNQILNTTVRELGQALSASRCCLAVIDARSPTDLSDDELVFEYNWHDPGKGGTALKNRVVLITEDSILRMILAQGSILSMDVLDNETFRPLFEDADAYPEDWRSIKSLVACPISTRERPIGLILLHQCDTLRTWSDSELELVHSVATHVALAMEHARLYAHSKALAEQELLINHIVRAVRSSLDLDTILSTVTRELGEALAVDRCQIGQPRTDAPLVVTHEFTSPGFLPAVGLGIYDEFPQPKSAASITVNAATVVGVDLSRLKDQVDTTDDTTVRAVPLAVISDVETDKRAVPFKHFLEQVGTKSLITAPLLDGTRLLGVLMVHQSSAQRQWQPTEVSLVAAIADQVSVAISHARLFSQVRFQAITDGLTGLYNHIYLKKRLSDELRRAQRKDMPLSLLMLDLDKLKDINDTYGHPLGDAAIRQVAWTLKNLLRSGDTAARYGGEEFAVILPETTLAEASRIAERLCRQINANPVAGLGPISVSIGAASYPVQASTIEDLVSLADQALYQAKNEGRNRVCVWECKAGA